MNYARILIFLGSALALASCAAPFSYYAEPLEARVIDEQTREPITGAVVVASWELIGGVHPDRTEVLVVREAVSDERGVFRIDGWGPVARPASGVLDNSDPELTIVKRGYLVGFKYNNTGAAPGSRVGKQLRDSMWNHRDIELKRRSANDWRRYIININVTIAGLRLVFDSPDCKWKQIPHAVRALEAEREYQIAQGIRLTAVPELSSLTSLPKCQPVDEFLRAYDAGG